MLGAVAPFLHFGIIGPLAAAGAVLTLSRWRRLGILYAMTLALLLAIAAFYVFARYRFPLVPLAVMFAGAGVIEFVQAARARQLGRSIAAVLAIAAVALAANLRINPEKRLDGIAYANVGAALAERGDIDAAMRFFQQAIEQSPQSPEPYYNIGVAYWLQGNTSLAMENLLQAKRLRPDLARVDFMLGAILEQEGNREDALRYYREALRVNPEDSDAAAAIKRLTSSGAL
jgi:tetratricopeptide (TPR) repeat protein